jgi:TonB-dependent starch-binding outer membrane protein SusC
MKIIYNLKDCRVTCVLMRSVLLILLLTPLVSKARETAQPAQIIELNLKEVSLRTALKEIERQTRYHFVVNESQLKSNGRIITLTIKSDNIKEVLDQLLAGTNITYTIKKKQIMLIPPDNSSQMSPVTFLTGDSSPIVALNNTTYLERILVPVVAVSGTVVEEDGTPLPGVNVVVKGTTVGTVTDSNGKFSIEVASPESVLVFSFIGFVVQEIPLGGQTTVNVTLKADTQTLSEVVVVGYGTQEKKDVTGSISSVKGSDFANLPVSAPQQALQGRAAGVTVVRSGGAPGDAGTIRVRGTGTVNDANPLIVIDGVPAGGLNDVNPNDIESIEVLKDASASAIYGTRAANGVVLVTTKHGKFGDRLTMSINGYAGVSSRIKSIDVLDAPTLAMLKRERYTNDGIDVASVWEDPQYQTQKTNWQDEVLGQGSISNIDLSISGGSEKSSFAISGAYYNEKGMISNSFFKRYSLRINSDHKIGNRLKIGQNLQITNQSGSVPNTLSAQDGLVWSAIRFNPGLPIKNADGTYSTSQLNAEFGDINNPIFTIDKQDKLDTRTRILGSVNGDFEILKGLHARANIAVDATYSDYREFNIKVLDQIRTTPINSLIGTNDKNYSLLQEYFLSYDKEFGKHTLGILAGYSQQTFDDKFSRTEVYDLPSEDPSQRYLTPDKDQTVGGFVGIVRTYDALQSAFARATYDFNNKYLATFTFRRDGSSKFGPNNKWANFPAFSVGWRMSEEPFFQNLKAVVSSLKLTGGWGQLGNQNIPSLQYLALIRTSGYRYSFGQNQEHIDGAAQSTIANPAIAWERAEMTNFGFESGFFQDQVLATVSYFNKQTKDMLLEPPSLGSNGTAQIPYQNVGELENKGLEIELSYRKSSTNFSYSLSGNATFITNKVTKLYNGNFIPSKLYGRSSSEITRTYEGHPLSTFYGWRTDGLYQNAGEIASDPNISDDPRREDGLIQPGDVRFVDLNGDHIIDDEDRTVIGSPQPKLTYGFTASAGYKGFDLTLFFLGVANVDIYNADRMQGIDPTYPFNMYAETINRWHGEGTSNSIPRMTTARDNLNHRTSDMFVESGAFFRLKNITLGYSLPASIIETLHLSKARFYITGQNVFIITKYNGMDPELGFIDGNRQVNVDYAQYPQARTWTIGAQLSF